MDTFELVGVGEVSSLSGGGTSPELCVQAGVDIIDDRMTSSYQLRKVCKNKLLGGQSTIE